MDFTFLISKHCGMRSYCSWFNELTSLIVLWPFLHYCKMTTAFLKKSQPGSRQEKGCYGKQISLSEGSKTFPKSTQQTSTHDSLAIIGSQGYTFKHFALPDFLVELGWEEGEVGVGTDGACHRCNTLIGQTWFTSSFVKLEWTLLPQD